MYVRTSNLELPTAPDFEVFFTVNDETQFDEHIVAVRALALNTFTIDTAGLSEDEIQQYDILSLRAERVGSFRLPFDVDSYAPSDKDNAPSPLVCTISQFIILGSALQHYSSQTRDACMLLERADPHNAGTLLVARRTEGRMAQQMATTAQKYVEIDDLSGRQPTLLTGFRSSLETKPASKQ